MFNSLQPPLLVQPITTHQTTLFPSHKGYCVHLLDEDQALVSYKDGWTFPMSNLQQRFVSAQPLLLLRESGGITSASSTFKKGFAHHFCQEDGSEIDFETQAIFPDQLDEMWMLIPNRITMIWLQYGNKNQYCGDSGYEMERIYYGKLLIREFVVEENFAPRLGRDAAHPIIGAKQYHVHSNLVYNGSWSLIGLDSKKHLEEILASQKLERYQAAVTIALKRAGYLG